MDYLFTSEQVSAGHPDKICDQISDSLLTECLRQDPNTRAGIECLIKGNNIVVAGELTTTAQFDVKKIALDVLRNNKIEDKVDIFEVNTYLSRQSPNIADKIQNNGAGDQGMMFGFACRETLEMMPLPWMLATTALKILEQRRAVYPFILADAKSQVTYNYTENKIDTFIISTQHSTNKNLKEVEEICKQVIAETCELYKQSLPQNVIINPGGNFIIGSSWADAGLTGRKIIADTYGGVCPHGGGAFSGKDYTKMDRSGAYAARWIAKRILWEHPIFNTCTVQLAYSIGQSEPVSIAVTCDKYVPKSLFDQILNKYDLTPNAIEQKFGLKQFDYTQTSVFGHFGKENLPWEKIK